MKTKVMITGFEPLWGLRATPSGEIVKSLPVSELDTNEILPLIIEQEFEQSFNHVSSAINWFHPKIIIMLGAMMKNEYPHLENFALNIQDSSVGDNTRVPVKHRKITQNGPDAYSTNVDIVGLQNYLHGNSLPSKISYNAGTHVCNSLYYKVLRRVRTENLGAKAIFIHVPFPNSLGVTEWENVPTVSQLAGYVTKTIEFLKGDV